MESAIPAPKAAVEKRPLLTVAMATDTEEAPVGKAVFPAAMVARETAAGAVYFPRTVRLAEEPVGASATK